MALRAYAPRARRGSHRLVVPRPGPPDVVAEVVNAYGVGTVRQPDGQIDHLVATFLIDGEGQIARRFIGLEHEPEELRKTLEGLSG